MLPSDIPGAEEEEEEEEGEKGVSFSVSLRLSLSLSLSLSFSFASSSFLPFLDPSLSSLLFFHSPSALARGGSVLFLHT